MNNNVDNIYQLVTQLCEKFVNDSSKIKKSRSKCYEILLGKTYPNQIKLYKDLNGTKDPVCNLISWQFILANQYDMIEQSNELKEIAESVEDCYGPNKDDFKNVLQFLLSLRNIPRHNDKILDLSSLPNITVQTNFLNIFRLPATIANEWEGNEELERLKEKSNIDPYFSERPIVSSTNLTNKTLRFSEIFKDEGYFSPTKVDLDIWELAATLEYSNRRTWEDYGHAEPDKELPFLSELGDLSSLWVENLPSLYFIKMFRDGNVLRTITKSRKSFVNDTKYLLVGMVSDSFGLNNHGEFYLTPCVSIDGITPSSLELYCHDLLFCGTCYKALEKISTPNQQSGKYEDQGYIFSELCKSINRYLQFYRTATLSLPDSTPMLSLHDKTYPLRLQIVTLTSICKVGPYTEAEQMPHGVALLNYLYQRVLTLTDKNVLMVLYSILYPCCQVYFSRFLKQWILEGTINDPYGEFFIKSNFNYISTRGRTYWTRSFSLREDIVPDFLTDLRMDILYCGKVMNLLKLCVSESKLCLYLMGKKPPIVSCCLTTEQLSELKQSTTNYYLEVCADCGLKFNLSEFILRNKEVDPNLLSLIAKKRNVTLKRLELERKKTVQDYNEKRQEELLMLKEQYDAAIEMKQVKVAAEIEKEMILAQENAALESMRQELVEQESTKLIEYYTRLCETSDQKREKIEKNLEALKSIQMQPNADSEVHSCVSDNYHSATSEEGLKIINIQSNDSMQTGSSGTSYFSIDDLKREEVRKTPEKEDLDVINANNDVEIIDNVNGNTDVATQTDKTKYDENIRMAIKNFEMAKKIKRKVMSEEMGLEIVNSDHRKTKVVQCSNITDAMRNKLRVLTSEFGIDVASDDLVKEKTLSIVQVNKNRMMQTAPHFYGHMYENDNDNFTNKNVAVNLDNGNKTVAVKRSKSLMLDLNKPKQDLERPTPMSVDSTPQSDQPLSTATTPASTLFDSLPATADTQQTDEGFDFSGRPVEIKTSSTSCLPTRMFSKRVTPQEATGLTTNCLKLLLNESIMVPLVTQTKLANNELLRYFTDTLGYLDHLNSLRNYFFLQDGEFGRNITENLFEKLYVATVPKELINCRTLHFLVFGALDNSGGRSGENSGGLSFKINNLPKCFDLGNPDVLDCLSLTYRVAWPMNILLPVDALARYDEVFKFLVKVNRMQWVLKKTFLELKVLARETGKKEIYLMASPQYRKLHQCRHVMMHFIQTFQNYIVGEVLQSSWAIFEKSLMSARNLDDLYASHTAYIKNILFMCLLNKKTVILRNIIHKVFVVILKFYDYLRSYSWICSDGVYVHPNFEKLESIFRNFKELVRYFFKVSRKVAKCGYQPHLIQLLDMLDINGFYSKSKKT